MIKRFLIRIPAGNGVKQDYVEVDPHTLHLGVLTQLYEWDSRNRKHVALLGNENLINTGIDPADLLEKWAGFMEQIDLIASQQTGSAASYMTDIRAVAAELANLIAYVASGQLGAASKVLDNVGYGIVQAAATSVGELARLEAQATRQSQLAEAMVGIVADQDERTHIEAEMLAQKIDEGLRAFATLQGFEAELDEVYEQLLPKSRAWEAFDDDGPDWLQERLDWLANMKTGFCTQASQYLYATANPDAAEAMAVAVTGARKQVQVIEDRIRAAQAEQAGVKTSTEATLSQQLGIDNLIRAIRDCRKAVTEVSDRDVDAYSQVSGLITLDEYYRWQELSRDPNWQSLHRAQVRFRDKAEAIYRLFDHEPKLSDAGQSILKRTRHYIERLEVELSNYDQELDEAEEAQVRRESVAVAVPDTDSRPKAATDRLDEVYELMQAVAAIKYCGPQPLRLGTSHSMLNILRWLGRITTEEMETYEPIIDKKLEADSVFVDVGEDRLAAWQETDPSEARWIMVRQHRGRSVDRFPMFKLVEQAHDKGLSLSNHYGLDAEDVAKAVEALKKARKKR